MLEIVARILCAMLAIAGINFILQALIHLRHIHAAAFVASLLAGVFTLAASVYFFNVVDDQATGARKALETIQQQADEELESLYKQFGQ